MPLTSLATKLMPKFKSILLFVFIVTAVHLNLMASEQEATELSILKTSPEAIIAKRVEGYVDEYLPNFLEKNHVPAATFILVDKNGPLLLKGYGKHSYENGNPIEPDKHLFRIASITKTMTGLGVMKLVNEGKIDLDADVNQYFTRFQIPDTFEQPITTRYLLQHNSGISDEFVSLSFTEIAERRSMGDFLEQHVPQRFFPPGKYGSYTNRAFMLLGHMIEEVSGESYEDWMVENIFQPLGMNNTRFSLTEQQKPWFTVGTVYVDGKYQKYTSVDTISRPSGDAISTATDMGRYASMLLNNGVIDGEVFLKPETTEQIFSDCFTHHEIFEKACLSFARTELPDGTLRFQHSGNYIGWRSDFAFFPELGVGYFVSTNGPAEYVSEFRQGIAQAITNQIFDAKTIYKFADTIDRADELTGNYRTQFISSTFEKIYHLIVGDSVVSLKDESTLLFNGSEYKQISPLVFRSTETGSPLVFEANKDGEIKRYLTPIDWFSVGEKLTGWQKAEFQIAWLKYALILSGLLVILLLIISLHSPSRKKIINTNGKGVYSFLLLTNLLWISPLAVLWLTDTTDIMAIQMGLSLPMKTAFMLINLAVLSTFIYWLQGLPKLFISSQNFISRLVLIISMINTAGLVFWVNYWNLISALA